MTTSKAAVVISAMLGKIASILGYAVGLMSLLVIIVGAFDMDSDGAISAMIFFLIVLGLSVFSVIKGIQIKKRIKRFKTYVGLISVGHMTSLESLASSTSQSVDFVRTDLQKMINKKFFANAVIDMTTNEIMIGGRKDADYHSPQAMQQNIQTENETTGCPGCGAMNTKPKGMQIDCEYCGSAVK